MHQLQTQIVQFWWSVQALPWAAITAYLSASTTVVIVSQFIKRKLGVEGRRKVLSLVSGVSVIPSMINYLASDQGQAWAAVLPKQFAFIFSGSILIHAFIASPLIKKITKVLQPYWQAVAEIKAQDSAPSAPVVPVEPVVEVAEKPLVIQG